MTATPTDRGPALPRGIRTELLVGAAVVAAYALLVVARLVYHDGDPTVFLLAGELTTDPAAQPDMFLMEDANGYDGQAYYRLARNPFTSGAEEFGISYERPAYWQRRIGYPLLVWLLSGFGRAALVPSMMIAVNLAAVGVIAAVGARLARMHGRSPWWGAVPASWAGYIVAVSQDLTEAVVGALVISGVLAARRRSWVVTAACFSAAALTRETSLIVPAAMLLTSLSPAVRRAASARAGGSTAADPAGPEGSAAPGLGAPQTVPVLVAAAPLVLFAVWHWAIGRRWSGFVSTGEATDAIFGLPFQKFGRFLADVVSDPGSADLVNLVQLGLTIAALVLVGRALLARDSGTSYERLALAGLLLLFTCLPVWHRGQAYLRWACEPVMLGWLLVIGSRATARLRPLAAVVAVLWVVVAVDLARFPSPDLDVRASDPVEATGPPAPAERAAITAPASAPAAGP